MYLNLTPCCLPSRNRKNIISQLDEGFLYVLYGEYQCHVSRVCIGTYSHTIHTIHTYTPTYLHIYIHAYIHILGPTYIHTYIHTYYCTLLWLTVLALFFLRYVLCFITLSQTLKQIRTRVIDEAHQRLANPRSGKRVSFLRFHFSHVYDWFIQRSLQWLWKFKILISQSKYWIFVLRRQNIDEPIKNIRFFELRRLCATGICSIFLFD